MTDGVCHNMPNTGVGGKHNEKVGELLLGGRFEAHFGVSSVTFQGIGGDGKYDIKIISLEDLLACLIGVERNGCCGNALWQSRNGNYLEALLPKMAKRIKAMKGGITINDRSFPEVPTVWGTVVMARLNQIVNEYAISIDERPKRENYGEREAEVEIRRLKIYY